MKKTIYISGAVVILVLIALLIFNKFVSKDESSHLEIEVAHGDFEILVTITGELQAERSTMIMGPPELRSRNLRIHQLKIQDLIPEGTLVDSGDYVAQIDKAETDNTLKDAMDALEQRESALLKTKLDTTIQLRNLRDEMINMKYTMEEMEITLEQSKFEPPATIRQAQINLDKAQRAHAQAMKNYLLKVQQSKADMRESEIDLAKRQRTMDEMMNVLNKFTIYAPAPGMVIYYKEFGGQKRTVGSSISPWDLTVATLPDLSSMISKTYVNEIDVSKLKVGQDVRIGVDAFPDKVYTGVIINVANIGEQLPNTDAKVFEVVIKVNETDPILRPSMTTSNQIITSTFEDVLYIPLEAVHATDSFSYVFTKSGQRQIVVLGESNENEIIVEMGLEEGEKLLLSMPEEPEKFAYQGEELIAVTAQRKEQKRLEKEALQEEAMRQAAERKKRMMQMRPMQGGQFDREDDDSSAQRSPTMQRVKPSGGDQEQPGQRETQSDKSNDGTKESQSDGNVEEKLQETKK